jgi:hypothetical protein
MTNRQLVYGLFDLPFVIIQQICREFGYDHGNEHRTKELLGALLDHVTAQKKIEQLKIRVEVLRADLGRR